MEGTPTPDKEMGVLSRLLNVFVSPAMTFESVARKRGWDWLVPVLLLASAFALMRGVMLARVDVEEAVEQQLRLVEKMTGSDLPADKKQEMEDGIRDSVKSQASPPWLALTSLAVFIPVFLVPALYHGIAALFGASGRYMSLVAGYAYVQVPQILSLLLGTLVALPKDRLGLNDVQYNRVLKSNPAAFLDFESTNKVVLAILSSLDVFDVWVFALGVIMVSRVTRFGVKGAAATVGTIWGVYILFKVVGAVLLSIFMG